ncbi:SDR family NAD(P)-dependent oxidoreductase, partial [Rhizobium johnstonii]
VLAGHFEDPRMDAAKEGIDEIETDIGTLDILINNAGMQFRTQLEDFQADKWELLLTTNISSVFYVGQAADKTMIARGQGKII